MVGLQKILLPDLIGNGIDPHILELTMKYIFGALALFAAYVFMTTYYGNKGVDIAERLINTPTISPTK